MHDISCQSFLGSFLNNEYIDDMTMRDLCFNYELAIIDSFLLSRKFLILDVLQQHILKANHNTKLKFSIEM